LSIFVSKDQESKEWRTYPETNLRPTAHTRQRKARFAYMPINAAVSPSPTRRTR